MNLSSDGLTTNECGIMLVAIEMDWMDFLENKLVVFCISVVHLYNLNDFVARNAFLHIVENSINHKCQSDGLTKYNSNEVLKLLAIQ